MYRRGWKSSHEIRLCDFYLHLFICTIREKEILIHALSTQRFVLMMQATTPVTKTCSRLMPDFSPHQDQAVVAHSQCNAHLQRFISTSTNKVALHHDE